MSKRQIAFTLIELLVVIAIIGILSGLVVVAMGGTVNSANVAKAQVFSNSLRNALMLNLVSEWKFDELGAATNGTVTNDYWSGGNSCTLSTGDAFDKLKIGNTCVSGKCLFLDGNDDYLNCGSGSNLNIGDNITIGGWIKFQNGVRSVLLGRGSSGGVNRIYIFGKDSNNKLWWNYSTDGTLGNSAGDLYSNSTMDDNWHYVAISFSAGVSKFYIDGNLDKTTPLALTSIYSGLPVAAIYIGRSGWSGGTNASGIIDDIRIFNGIVSASQIKEQYYVGLNSLFAKGQVVEKEYFKSLSDVAIN